MKDIKQNNDKVGAGQPGHLLPHHAVLLFLKQQSISLYLGMAGLALVALVFVFYTMKTSRDNDQASRILGVARTSQQFEELIRQYPKSPSGPVAVLALASSYFSAGAYDAALERYNEFTVRYPAHPILPAAELGKVMCAEAKGEMGQALIGFNAFLQVYPDHFLTPQALFGKARCLQATGKLAEARIIYENFIAAHPENKWRANAESALQSIDRQMRLDPRGKQDK